MDREELWQKLSLMMEHDPNYQQALQQLNAVESDYTDLLKSLPPEKQAVLERYIAACEAMDDALVLLAYRLGKV